MTAAEPNSAANVAMLDAALAYLARGLPIFPVCGVTQHTHRDAAGTAVACTSRGKVPLVPWKTVQQRLPTEAEVRRWWRSRPDANIGLATGALSGIVVLDLDGDLALQAARAQGYDNGPHVFTGRVGGQHRYFAYRTDAPRNFAKRNGIDYRGEGGYVVLPPSRHVSGNRYVWGEELGEELPELPDWVDGLAADTQRSAAAPTVEGEIDKDRNVTLTSLGGTMRRRGFSQGAILAALRHENDTRCKPPLDDAEVAKIAQSVSRYPADEPARVEPNASISYDVWPAPLETDAYYGALGDFVESVAEDTEADPSALVIQMLSGISACLSPRTYMKAGDAFHPPRIFSVTVGPTAGGRKGTAGQIVAAALRATDDIFGVHIVEGLSSGEGLIWAIRDEIKGFDRKTQQEILQDPGITDKRLLVMETEFATTLRVLQREGSTLSAIIRRAWDLGFAGVLASLTKNSPARSTGAHIVLVGHITPREVKQYLDRTELMNGFGNRFLWAASRQSRTLPFGEEVDDEEIKLFSKELVQARDWTRDGHRMTWADDARDLWAGAYPGLNARPDNMYGAATARGAPYVIRIAETYAALDRTRVISRAHLTAALAVWRYSDRTCLWVFGDALGDLVADDILEALRAQGELTRTQISGLFHRNMLASRIGAALSLLLRYGLARTELRGVGAAQAEYWMPGEATNSTK